jgi:polyisoprenyl-phosphate glycosyltransferase|tara:strand:- start:218 stop:934 length:717 start_codon:yes stop_codon:yes gene_type:complete
MSVNFSLVLPCYNEEKNITLICSEFLDLPLENYIAELILVNNGSDDDTQNVAEKEIKNNSSKNVSIKLVNLVNNAGYGGGIAEGLKVAKGDYIGWAHADLQTPMIDFLKLYLRIKDKKNILGKGFRINNRGFDGIISTIHEKLASFILGYQMNEINAQPKIFNKELLPLFANMPYKWTTLDTYTMYTCLKNRIEIETIDVVFNTRKYGQSKWKNNFINFISHILFNFLYLFKLRFSKK